MHIGNTYSYLGTPNYRAGSLCSMCMYNLLKTSMCLKVVFMIDMFLSFLHTQMDIFSISDKIESVWTSQHVFDMSILTKTWQEEGFWIWRQKSCQLTYSWEESKTYSWYTYHARPNKKIRARLSFPRGAVKWRRVSFKYIFCCICIHIYANIIPLSR